MVYNLRCYSAIFSDQEYDLNLSCQNHVFISSFNTRTLNPSSRLSEHVLNAKLHKIDIIAIQEHPFFIPTMLSNTTKLGKSRAYLGNKKKDRETLILSHLRPKMTYF